MPRWLSGLGYVLGLLDRWIDSLYCSYFSHFFATQLLMYYNIATYSVYDSVGSPCPAPNAYRATLHAVLFIRKTLQRINTKNITENRKWHRAVSKTENDFITSSSVKDISWDGLVVVATNLRSPSLKMKHKFNYYNVIDLPQQELPDSTEVQQQHFVLSIKTRQLSDRQCWQPLSNTHNGIVPCCGV